MGTKFLLNLTKMVIVQKCVFSGSEMCSDAFETTESYDGFIIECPSQMVTKDAMQFDIGDSDDVNDEAQTVNNVADGFGMSAMDLKKGAFQAYIKKFMGKVKTHLEENNADRVADFMKNATAAVKYLLGKFDDLEFFLGDNDPTMEGHIGIACWKDPEADSAPTFFYFKDALKGEKY